MNNNKANATAVLSDGEMLRSVVERIEETVAVRTEATRLLAELQRRGEEAELAAEEMSEAVEAYHHAECALGSAHLALVVAQSAANAGTFRDGIHRRLEKKP